MEAACEVERAVRLAGGHQLGRQQRAARRELGRLPEAGEDRVVTGAEPVAGRVRHPVPRAHRAQDLDVLAGVEAGDLLERRGLRGEDLGVRQRGEAVGLHELPREPEPLHAERVLAAVVELAPLVGVDDRGCRHVWFVSLVRARFYSCARSARLRLRLAKPLLRLAKPLPRVHGPDLPPDFSTRQRSVSTMPLSTALAMSYTVRPATAPAVRASISTPVLSTVRTRASTVMVERRASSEKSTSTPVMRRGWHSGMRSGVRLAAMMPAVRATPSTSPLASCPARTAARVAAFILRVTRAAASRTVSDLAETSTMRASPAGVRCERPRNPGISRGGYIGRVLDPTQAWVAARACRRRLSIRSFAMSLSFF